MCEWHLEHTKASVHHCRDPSYTTDMQTRVASSQPPTGLRSCSLEDLPRRIFLDSCTAQTLRDYGGYIYEGEPIPDSDRIWHLPDGIANLQALRDIFLVTERAQFEFIVSAGSLQEASDKRDIGHLQWLWDIADHSNICLQSAGPTVQSEALSDRLDELKFGYLSKKDQLLLRQAIILRCEAFLTVERKLPRNAAHIERELGIRVLTPVVHWEMLRPWAALWC
jgi:hypothetical protein